MASSEGGESLATAIEPHKIHDTILVIDAGSQYTHIITRRLREMQVYSEMLPCTQKLADLTWKPKGIIISGGPYSVYEEEAPDVDPAIFEDPNMPVLGICYGLQLMTWHLSGGKHVVAGEKREYGHADVEVQVQDGSIPALFKGLPSKLTVWMSHGDKLSELPPDFVTTATTKNAPFAGIAHKTLPYYGIQFHPEVTHTPLGKDIISNFVNVCSAKRDWTMSEFVDQEIERIRALVGPKGQVIGAVSGGVDSTVAAKLMDKAIGHRFHAVLVDNGLLRQDEAKNVKETLTNHLKINLHVVDASDRFLEDLKGVIEPEQKRKIIGGLFIDVFQETAVSIADAAKNTPGEGPIEWLLQGTLYPDVIESISFKGGKSSLIKTHHNVGGLPARMSLKLIEPLRELFKDEVRDLGTKLGLTPDLVWRHPFPGPGLAIRILGEVSPEQLRIARQADSIFIDEIKAAKLYRETSQAFAAVLPVKAVGVMGDKRVHEQVIALRAVQTTDFMTADWYPFSTEFLKRTSSRIVNEVSGVSRVFYDVTR